MSHERRIPVSLTPDGYDMLAACGRVLCKTMDQMLDESLEGLSLMATRSSALRTRAIRPPTL